MSRQFRLRLKFSGAIAKRLQHVKNQLSVLGSFFNQFVTDIIYKRALLACATRQADTLCSLEAFFGWHTMMNYKVDNISKYVYLTVIIDITRKITKLSKFQLLMIVLSYVKNIHIHSLLKFQTSIN